MNGTYGAEEFNSFLFCILLHRQFFLVHFGAEVIFQFLHSVHLPVAKGAPEKLTKTRIWKIQKAHPVDKVRTAKQPEAHTHGFSTHLANHAFWPQVLLCMTRHMAAAKKS